MLDSVTFDLSLWQWVMLTLCALLIGSSKTGMPGLSILVVPIMASILPAKQSVGVLLPMLIFADIFAIAYYHRHAQWKHVTKIIPWTLLGIAIGYGVMSRINSTQLRPIIGGIILLMLALWSCQNYKNKLNHSQITNINWSFIAVLGLSIGITTMLANAAGPLVTIYLLSLALPKERFIGTGAWYVFIINLIKVPLNISLGLITVESIKLDIFLLPLIFIGAATGIFILRVIPQRMFNLIVIILAATAAIRLLI